MSTYLVEECLSTPSEVSKKQQSPKITEGCWEIVGNHHVQRNITKKTLPSGAYLPENIDGLGYVLTKMNVMIDGLLDLKDATTDEILKNVSHFWKSKQTYEKSGFSWKRGIFLWGPPGGGKTSCINLLISSVINEGGVCFYVKSTWCAIKCIEKFRELEPNRRLLVVMEDIDAMIKNQDENDVLSILDGQFSTNSVVYVATTNYPERLERRIINRPSRFDLVREIGYPSPEGRKIYLKTKATRFFDGKNEEELELWIKKTERYTISHLKELVLLTECFGRPLEEGLKSLQKMLDEEISSDDYNKQKNHVGFV